LAVINRYGFNSQGVDVVKENLRDFREHYKGTVGVNIGKNKTGDANHDYALLIRELGPLADYLVVNISSPNTPGLRDLQILGLEVLLLHCKQARQDAGLSTPLLVKIAPDLTDAQLQEVATACLTVGLDGIVVCNTTTSRPDDLISRHALQEGGLSGAPIKDRSTECIRKLYEYTNGELLIIGVGGVGSGKDAWDKLTAGASLVQLYSMMVYQGPGVVSRVRHELAEIMLQNGKRSLNDVIGCDHDEIFWKRQQEQTAQNRRRNSGVLMEELVVETSGAP
jgi:dihydroorotate dehydrogenase